jgi:bifunctional ADP-heptose synthase (sugar kinase/adenylyltransferase)
LDTRTKIVTIEEARKLTDGKPARWVAGDFDPLLAGHVSRLHEFAAPDRLLVVGVSDIASPLLPLRARAELVAALAMVDCVVAGAGGGSFEPLDDAPLTARLAAHIVQRHGGETGQ